MARSLASVVVFVLFLGCGSSSSVTPDFVNSSDLGSGDAIVNADSSADTMLSDQFASDALGSDILVSDALVDGALPDLVTVDMTLSTDLVSAADLASVPDLATALDLAVSADLATSDLAVSMDLAFSDLVPIPDLDTSDGATSTDLVASDLGSVDLGSADLGSADLAQIQYDVQIQLAAQPGNTKVVRNSMDVPSVGITVTANKSLTTVSSFVFTHRGTGSISGVPVARLYWGNLLMANAFPDVNKNTFTFTGFLVDVRQGTQEAFVVKANYGPVSDGTHIFDLVDASSVGIVQNLSKGPFPVNPDKMIVTVLTSGVLTVTNKNLRTPTILVAGGDVWQRMTDIEFCALYESVTLSRVNLEALHGSDFVAGAFAMNKAVRGIAIFPGQSLARGDADFTQNPIFVPMNGCVETQLWGKLDSVRAWSLLMGSPPGSGDELKLGLSSDKQDGSWNANYKGMYNIVANGNASFQPVYTAAPMGTLSNPTIPGVPGFTLRKTRLTITRHPLMNTNLILGTDPDLMKIQMSADPMGSASWKKFTVRLSTALSMGSKLLLSSFRLRRGNQDLAPASVKITDCNGNDLVGGVWDTSQNPCRDISVVVVNEEVITGAGIVYTLHANVSGVLVGGDVLMLQLLHPGAKAVTGDYATIQAKAPFVWSDQSDLPHSEKSHDWIDDFQLEDLTGIWVLVR